MILSKQSQVDCCLCREVGTRQFPAEYQSAYGVHSRISYETDNFAVLPTLSPLCAGHVLILPRVHTGGVADLSQALHQALLTCIQSIFDQLARHFGTTVFCVFEHGARTPGLSCGIDHAHLHVLPLSPATAEFVEVKAELDFPAEYTGPFLNMLSKAAKSHTKPYLLHGMHLDSMRLALDKPVPSQYMRRLIREAQSRSDWDWKLLSGKAEFLATCNAFQAA